jgi:hypothetical protein
LEFPILCPYDIDEVLNRGISLGNDRRWRFKLRVNQSIDRSLLFN